MLNKDILIAGGAVVGVALLTLFLKNKGSSTAMNSGMSSTGNGMLQGGYQTASTVFVPTSSYDIHYDTNNGMITQNTLNGNTTTTYNETHASKPAVQSISPKTGRITQDTVMYASPSTTAKVVGHLSSGHGLKAYAYSNGFYDVGMGRWVQAAFIDFSNVQTNALPAPKPGHVIHATDMYSSPIVKSAASVGHLNAGHGLKAYEYSNGMYDVGMGRWVPASDIQFN